ELFDLGADLSVPIEHEARLRVTQEQIDWLEDECDRFNAELPELKSFVLPGGSETAARLHVARTVCRRAEREALVAAAGGRHRPPPSAPCPGPASPPSSSSWRARRTPPTVGRSRSGGLGAPPSVRRGLRRGLLRLDARARARHAATAVHRARERESGCGGG